MDPTAISLGVFLWGMHPVWFITDSPIAYIEGVFVAILPAAVGPIGIFGSIAVFHPLGRNG